MEVIYKTPKLSKFVKLATAIVSLSLGALTCSAVTFHFNVTFDGATASVDGPGAIAGETLTPGDDFVLNVRAAGSDYWVVNSTFSNHFSAVLAISEVATRTVDVVTTLFLDGAQVQQRADMDIGQANIHLGTQEFDWVAGTSFDHLEVRLLFLAINPPGTATTIADSPDVIGNFQNGAMFLRNDEIVYTKASASVPDSSSTFALLFVSFITLAGFRRKAR